MLSQVYLLLILCVGSFLLGSIPTGYLVAKRVAKINIKEVGSGSTGSTNVSRAMGVKWGILVGALDVIKGVIPTVLALNFLSTNAWYVALVCLLAPVGHIFTPWLGFKGGKGVATAFGIIIPLMQWFSIFLILCWLLMLSKTKIMSFTNLVLFSLMPLVFFIYLHSIPYLYLGLALWLLLTFAHRENIKRMYEGTEKPLGISKQKDKNPQQPLPLLK